MAKKFDFVGIGLCVIDLVGRGECFPAEDSKVALDECDWQAGGSTATGLVAAVRLGAKATFLGQLGLDYFGQRILESLKNEGINTSHVRVYHDVLSQYAFSYTNHATGSRTMFINFNKHWNTYTLDDAAREQIANCRVLMIDRHEAKVGLEAVQIANSKGIPSVYDPSTKIDATFKLLLEEVTYPVVPIDLVKKYSHDTDLVRGTRKMLKKKNEAIVVTCGDQGCLIVTKKNDKLIPAFKVKVVDTLGAGDVFHGAFAYGIWRRWNLEHACTFASAVAALKCKHLGGRRGIPNMRQVKGFLHRRGHHFV